jgi:hypothetical protein
VQTRLEAAQTKARESKIELDKFRQVEAARMAASRWARIRAAWRGE